MSHHDEFDSREDWPSVGGPRTEAPTPMTDLRARLETLIETWRKEAAETLALEETSQNIQFIDEWRGGAYDKQNCADQLAALLALPGATRQEEP